MVEEVVSEDFLPVRVSVFDDLITHKGLQRGTTILVSGGCGTGKTIFAMQSCYNAALNGEKVVFLTLEESPAKIKANMKRGFGWDINKLEKENKMFLKRVDPISLSRDVELAFEDEHKNTERLTIEKVLNNHPEISLIDSKTIELPFKPDRIVLDSISALSNTFRSEADYRLCVQVLVQALNAHNSVNFMISETEQEPTTYSLKGVEEFLVDGVIVFYNIRKGQLRRRALEILKLRSSDHVKELVPYRITKDGLTIMPGEKIL